MTNAQNQVRDAAATEYRRNQALQAEFSSEAAYVAFRCAKARGAAKIFAPAAPTKSYTADSARGARVEAAAAPGQPRMNIIPGCAVARDDREAVKAIVREFQQTHRPGSYLLDDVAGFIAERAGLTQAQARYAHEQCCSLSRAVE